MNIINFIVWDDINLNIIIKFYFRFEKKNCKVFLKNIGLWNY